MAVTKILKTPISTTDLRDLKSGDIIYISGYLVTIRDLGYQRALKIGFPLDINGLILYHCGPLAKKINNSWKILSAGPTTSTRFEHLIIKTLERYNVRGFIGKGSLSSEARAAFKRYRAFYGLFPGGAGALASRRIKKICNVHWLDLGTTEALWVLEVQKFGPIIVAIDPEGRSIFKDAYFKL